MKLELLNNHIGSLLPSDINDYVSAGVVDNLEKFLLSYLAYP